MRGGRAVDQLQDLRKVQLALGVVGRELGQGVPEGLRVKAEDPGVDLVDRELLVGGIAGALGLDDALDGAVAVADHTAVAGRVVEDRGEHRRAGGVGVHERGDRLGGDERHVAGQDDDGAGAVDLGCGGSDGAAGAVGLRLDRDVDVVGEDLLGRRVGRVDHHDVLCAGLLRGDDRPQNHRPPAQIV